MRYSAIIIDDEKWTREALKKIGKWEEMNIGIIAEASDGEYGLSLIDNLRPDIIISDVKMPNMDGISLLREIRARGCNAKIIFVSGYDDFELVRNAMQLKANDYLLKPVKAEELNKQLRRCVDEIAGGKAFGGESAVQFHGIVYENWADEFRQLENEIYETLKAGNHEMMKHKFEKISEVVLQEKKVDISKDDIIYIFFCLQNLLQKYITESGYKLGEILDRSCGAYVFGEEFSLNDMLNCICSLYGDTLVSIERKRKDRNRVDLQSIKKYVDENYRSDITLEATADAFFISKEYLSKLFKNEVGVGFSNYITKMRMCKAKELLESGVPIRDVSDMVGYKDIAHFYKVFKKHFNVNPGSILVKTNKIQ